MTLAIDYSLRGAGWSKCTVSFEGMSCELTASYLGDALGNLVLAAVALYSGYQSLAFGFDEEPGEYRWVFERLDGTDISVQILEFPDLWSNAPNASGKQLLAFRIGTVEFAREVHRAANAVLQKHGVEGYLEQWAEHPFPEHQLSLLEQLLKRYDNDA